MKIKTGLHALERVKPQAEVEEYAEKDLVEAKAETHIGLCLDSSGSMGLYVDEVIRGFNKQLKEIRRHAEHRVKTWLALFGTWEGVEFSIEGGEVGDLYDLTRETYMPCSLTPLLDALGATITRIDDEVGRDAASTKAYLVVIFSDGGENSSRNFSWGQVSRMVKQRKKTGRWTFIFVGPAECFAQMKAAGFNDADMLVWDQLRLPETFGKTAAGIGRYLAERNHGLLLGPGEFLK